MKKNIFILVSLALCLLFTSSEVGATGLINLYVDAAPDTNAVSNYSAWKANAYTDASNWEFVNMQNSHNPGNSGTNNFEIKDAIINNFNTLGSSLSYLYWVPFESISSLLDRHFQVAMSYVWDGVSCDLYGGTWVTPTRWENYDNGHGVSGVIGIANFAWMATPSTDINVLDQRQGDVTFYARMDEQTGLEIESLTARHSASVSVPEPTTAVLLSISLIGLAGVKKSKKGSSI